VTDTSPIDRTLESAWQALSPPAGLEARVRARVLAGSGGGSTDEAFGARAAAAAPRAPSRWTALRASGSLGAGVGAALLALGFLAGYWARPPAPPAPTAASTAPTAQYAARREVPSALAGAPAVPAPEPHDAREQPPQDTAAPRAPHTAVPPRKAPPRATERLDAREEGEELLFLARAERAVRNDNPALARALTRELAERFPRSPLHEERRAIELMALCQQEDPTRGARLAAFERDYPKSVYAERIAGECDTDATRATPSSERSLDVDSTKRDGEDMNRLEGGQHGPASLP
jgi:hypothetical protein